MDPFWILPALFVVLWALLVRLARRRRGGTETTTGLARRGMEKHDHDHSGYDAATD